MKSGGMKLMKHWCYYANVVRYLEKLEANAVKKKKRGAYLVWRDDEGPHMIAGPDIYWHRGAGPMPDLAGLNISIRPASAASVSKRSAPAALSTPPTRAARVSKRSAAAVRSTPPTRAARVSKRSPAAVLSTPPTGAARVSKRSAATVLSPPEKANKRRTTFPKPAHRNNRAADGSLRSKPQLAQ